ncbi:hypothetical protein SBA7_1650008 [Candidatus Sulfotelmatobacter sp. SbA7]|nr:hypothetical protein SBA7_1650008 [Candidatus Sulfotelmatobacter sp. SbA7]
MCNINIDVCSLKLAYWLIAASASVFYAIFAVDALEVSEDDKQKIAKNRPLRWHQRWLNFLGSLVGWSLPILSFIVLRHARTRLPTSV